MKKALNLFRHTFFPLLLMVMCPPAVMLVWYTNTQLKGSLSSLWQILQQGGVAHGVKEIWSPYFFGSPIAWVLIGSFMLLQLILMRFVPGKRFLGPVTPKGNVPVYRANGLSCFLITVGLFCTATFGLNLFSATLIYDHFGQILGALTLFSLIFCLGLYFKGRFWPSSSDHGYTGNVVFDYYWGTELYPRVFGFDIKMFTNCRFGMMSWGLIIISYAAKQKQLYGLSDSMVISVVLQLIYIAKFFVWETGYLKSLDIMHDRAGFYICWGCLVWVPCIYTSPSMYLVHHPHHLGWAISAAILGLGSLSILTNYLADRQRQRIRLLNGVCKVWGKKPVVIEARYATSEGEIKDSLLLASGFWGISRHFHYLPEILAAFFWSSPALFSHFLPYFYVLFLIILLADRAIRDDARCSLKYGAYWQAYCSLVPYKILPYIY